MNNEYTLSVTKFNSIIKNIFNAEELLHNVKIVGEVFGISCARGALYFQIKDEESSLPCVCFKSEIFSQIVEGEQVVVTGSPNFYVKGGRFSFLVSGVEAFGLGMLFKNFLILKDKLTKEGLFDEAHKKAIPSVVKRIGVVTSRDGAVIQDIKNVTWRRNAGVDIVLFHTKVQGKDAEREIADGINFFSDYDGVDVVVVARGGGSLEDLAAYNTEIIARAIFACNKPIVSAVGHETDFTISDFAADLRAPTPSAAAELLTKDTANLHSTFKREVERLSRLLDGIVADKTTQLQELQQQAMFLMQAQADRRARKLEKLSQNVAGCLERFVTETSHALELKLLALKKLNPLDILSLGYAKIEQAGKTIAKRGELDLNKTVEINFVDGRVDIKINQN